MRSSSMRESAPRGEGHPPPAPEPTNADAPSQTAGPPGRAPGPGAGSGSREEGAGVSRCRPGLPDVTPGGHCVGDSAYSRATRRPRGDLPDRPNGHEARLGDGDLKAVSRQRLERPRPACQTGAGRRFAGDNVRSRSVVKNRGTRTQRGPLSLQPPGV